jgi:hypothetical protein
MLGAAATNGGIVYPFTASTVQNRSGRGRNDRSHPAILETETTRISVDALITLLNSGTLYTNVHTAANAGGRR